MSPAQEQEREDGVGDSRSAAHAPARQHQRRRSRRQDEDVEKHACPEVVAGQAVEGEENQSRHGDPMSVVRVPQPGRRDRLFTGEDRHHRPLVPIGHVAAEPRDQPQVREEDDRPDTPNEDISPDCRRPRGGFRFGQDGRALYHWKVGPLFMRCQRRMSSRGTSGGGSSSEATTAASRLAEAKLINRADGCLRVCPAARLPWGSSPPSPCSSTRGSYS